MLYVTYIQVPAQKTGAFPKWFQDTTKDPGELPLLPLLVGQGEVFYPGTLSGPDPRAQTPELLWFHVQSAWLCKHPLA